MSDNEEDLRSICTLLQNTYSACDISDALLKLKVRAAGVINPDLLPIREKTQPSLRLVAPVSTVCFVRKTQVQNLSLKSNDCPLESNIPKGQNWTDCPAPGTIVLAQQPEGYTPVALLGDIMITRLKSRGVLGAVVDGRIRDVQACSICCQDGDFHLWSRGFSAASPTLEVLPWAVNVPLQFEQVTVRPGDILCADEGDCALVVIPRAALHKVLELLPTLKEASDNVMMDVMRGMSLSEAVKRHPRFYSNYDRVED
ncbi:ribonuclease E inhibitor RraA/Dimethylmenaquinone methyltransferase [Aspergillus carlsbadensis]|nr:ribonuclease E inhibitor RraA/Dimethylmenaquinone methyltransferase [Aspergillus carlsbadensis]